MRAVLLKLSEDYESWLFKAQYSLVAFRPVETEESEDSRDASTGRPLESVYEYSMFRLLDAEDSIQVRPEVSERYIKIFILHQFMRMVLYDEDSSYTARFAFSARSNLKLNCFMILLSYYCGSSEQKHVAGT